MNDEKNELSSVSRFRVNSPLLLLVVLPCILFHQLFIGGCLLPANLLKDVYPWRTGNPASLVPWNVLQFDGITQFYPWRLFAAETWKSGYVPLWNPHQFCGTPFLANGQSAVLYLPNLIFLIMPVKFAFGWSALLHLIFTGVTAYLFFKYAGACRSWAAAVGAVCWQLSTWQISWITLPTFLDTSSWLPSALLGVWYFSRKPNARRAALVGLIVAMMVLAGHLQIAFYCILLTAAYALFIVWCDKIPISKSLLSAGIVIAISFLLTAAQILPTVELSHVSPRAGSGPTASGYAAYVRLALPFEQLAGLFIPGFFGHPELGTYIERTPYPENAAYISVFGLLMTVAAMIRRKLRGVRIFFCAAGILSILTALGTPLNMLLYYGIPGFSSTGSPARILVLFTFCMAFLAAQGADDLLGRERRVWLASGVFALKSSIICGYATWFMLNRDSGYLASISNDIRLFAGLMLASFAMLWLFSRNTISRKDRGAAMLALVAIDLLFVNAGYNPIVRPADVYPVTPAIAWLKQHAGYDRIMPINTSWSMVDPPRAVLPPNAATVYGLYDLQGYDSLQTASYKQFANDLNARDSSPVENGNMLFVNNPGSPNAREADARYLLSLTPLAGFGKPVITDGQVLVYEDVLAQPIWGGAQIRYFSADELAFQDSDAFKVAVQWNPGWHLAAQVPGSPFMHMNEERSPQSELVYRPASFQVGLYLTLVGITWLAAAASGYRQSLTSARRAV